MLKRFFKYSVVGATTFVFDLFLLYVFADVFNINYLISAAVAFFVAVSINYFVSRKNAFIGTKRGVREGYFYFLLIISFGAVLMLLLMYLMVEIFKVDVLYSRIMIAGLVGAFNFFVNDRFNFKMV